MPTAKPTGAYEPDHHRIQGRTKSSSRRRESGVELGHHISAYLRARDMTVALPVDRRLETQRGRLGCRRA